MSTMRIHVLNPMSPPNYMGNLMKMMPLFKEFDGQNPTHMGGTYPYQQYVMYGPYNKIQGFSLSRCLSTEQY